MESLVMANNTGDEGWYLSFHSTYNDRERPATPDELNLKAIVDLLDGHAENINAHDFVMCHRALAALLYHEVGEEKATQIFQRLAGYQGLHGMVGCAGAGDVTETEEDLQVQLRDWSSWELPS